MGGYPQYMIINQSGSKLTGEQRHEHPEIMGMKDLDKLYYSDLIEKSLHIIFMHLTLLQHHQFLQMVFTINMTHYSILKQNNI